MTRLKKIEIKGFRSLKHIEWEPENLNVVIGENGSGKSNLLWALELLHESAIGRLRESILAEGGLRQLLWNHRVPELSWSVTVADPGCDWHYELAVRGGGLLTWGRNTIERESLSAQMDRSSGQDGKTLKLIERDAQKVMIWNDEKRKLAKIEPEGTFSRLIAGPATQPKGKVPATLPDEGAEETALSTVGLQLGVFAMHFQWFLRDLSIYHEISTHSRSAIRDAAVTRVEGRLASDGQNLTPLLHTLYENSREFKRRLNAAMKAAFRNEFEELSFPPAADQKIQLGIRWKSLSGPVTAANLSDGTLRFLVLVAILANPDPLPLIAIDEPETGLHPRMFPIIAELAAAASERTTVILTTHSPQFLDAFSGECVPATTVAECADGETKLSKLDGQDLKRWLSEYSLGSRFASGELEALA